MKQNTLQKDNSLFIFSKKLLLISVFLISLYLLYTIKNIIFILFISLFLNILFAPFLNKLNTFKIRDSIGMGIIFLILFFLIGLTLFAIIPIIIEQLSLLIALILKQINLAISIYDKEGITGFGLPKYINIWLESVDLSLILNSLKENIGSISTFISGYAKNIISSGSGFIFSLTGALFNILMVFIFTFFIALERKQIRNFFFQILPQNTSHYLKKRENQIIQTLGSWLKGQIILAISIFFITLISLLVLKIFGIHIDKIFTLAIIAGMMEFIPFIGPILALIPAVAIALGISFNATLVIVILYIIIQQIESNVLVPYVMGKTLNLSTFAVLIGMMIGASLAGILGIILSVPIVAISQIFIKDYLNKKAKN